MKILSLLTLMSFQTCKIHLQSTHSDISVVLSWMCQRPTWKRRYCWLKPLFLPTKSFIINCLCMVKKLWDFIKNISICVLKMNKGLTVCFHCSAKSALSAAGNATTPLLWGVSNLGKSTPLNTMFTPCLHFKFSQRLVVARHFSLDICIKSSYAQPFWCFFFQG